MRRVPVSHRRPPRSVPRGGSLRPLTWPAVIAGVILIVGIADQSGQGRLIVSSVQRFLLFYSGVFALLALTGAVVVGLVLTDRVVMTPGSRVFGQALHRALAIGALVTLIAHIVLEIAAHRSHVIDAVVPFLARDRTLYVGIGTIASDLIVLIVVTSVLRGRFATRWPWAWRVIHATSYVAWVFSILHGLLAGRTAKPYVDWSYGVCVALVAVGLVIRFRAARRRTAGPRPRPLAEHPSMPLPGLPLSGRALSGRALSGRALSGRALSGRALSGLPLSGAVRDRRAIEGHAAARAQQQQQQQQGHRR